MTAARAATMRAAKIVGEKSPPILKNAKQRHRKGSEKKTNGLLIDSGRNTLLTGRTTSHSVLIKADIKNI